MNIEQVAPILFAQGPATLQGKNRPLLNGIQISSGGGICTLGATAVRNGVAGFVTNSHCTNVQGGVESTQFFQAAGSDQVGVEVADPSYFTGDSCPIGRRCRYSDSAFVRRDSGTNPAVLPATAYWGAIAFPNPNIAPFQIDTTFVIDQVELVPFRGLCAL